MSYELLFDTIFWTNLHLTEEYFSTYKRWLIVDVNVATKIEPPSTLKMSCTVTTPLIIIIIWSREFHPIVWVRCKIITTYSSKPSNSQWILFTGTSYTELIIVEVGLGLVVVLIINSHLPLASLC